MAAAQNGNLLAMFNLGLLYLDGAYIYYTCELGLEFLQAAAVNSN